MSNPHYPVYVISKGRAESRLTVKALQLRGIPFHVVIEPQELDDYVAVIPRANILLLPFSNLGQGSIPARNWVWEHAIESGAKRHWILDDNIRGFYVMNNNQKIRTTDGDSFRLLEEMVDKFTNVWMAGMQYESLCPRRKSHQPAILNTRIYSCILLDNSAPLRWRGRYNEDTDLSLRILKLGRCTMLFNHWLADKAATMTMKGGNTDTLYVQSDVMDGRLLMAQSLQKQHPDVTKVVWKWNRWQHSVDYSRFRKNRLIRK